MRLEVCDSCEHKNQEGTSCKVPFVDNWCGICKCPLEQKSRGIEGCPLKKW